MALRQHLESIGLDAKGQRIYGLANGSEVRMDVKVGQVDMGEIIGDLNTRRGRVRSMEARGGTQIVNARVPLAEMFGYATDLRSRTQGRATFSMHFDRYEQVPQAVSEEVVARIQGR